MNATLLAIHIAPEEGAPLKRLESADLDADQGIIGDRYYGKSPKKNVTLVEEHHVQAAAAGVGADYREGQTRRNLTVSGVDLNSLVGKQFRVGDVLLEGTALCQPCHWMDKTIGPGAKDLLKNKGGLRARILEGGTIQVGDSITTVREEVSHAS